MLQDCLQPMYLVAFFLIALITLCVCVMGQLKESSPSFEFTKGHIDDGRLTADLSMIFSQTDVMFQLRISLQQWTVHICTLVCSLSGVLQQWTCFNGSNCSCITWMLSLYSSLERFWCLVHPQKKFPVKYYLEALSLRSCNSCIPVWPSHQTVNITIVGNLLWIL